MNTNFGQYPGGQAQPGGGGFPGLGGGMQGLQSLQGGYIQNQLQQGRSGLGGLPGNASQAGTLAQQRLAGGSLGGLQQLGQAQGRTGLGTQQYAGVNGLGRPGTGLAGAVGLSPTLAQQQQQQQQQLRQAGAGGMGGLTGLGGGFNANLAALQRQGAGGQGSVGGLGSFGAARLGTGLGGMAGLGTGTGGGQLGGPSGDLLAMINKAAPSHLGAGAAVGPLVGGAGRQGGGAPGGAAAAAAAGGEQGAGANGDSPAFDAADFPSLTGGAGQQAGAPGSGAGAAAPAGQRHVSGGGGGGAAGGEPGPGGETFAALLGSHKPPGAAGGAGGGFSEEDFPALPGAVPGAGQQAQQPRGLDGSDPLQQLQQQLGRGGLDGIGQGAGGAFGDGLGGAGVGGLDMLRLQQQQLRQAAAFKVLGGGAGGGPGGLVGAAGAAGGSGGGKLGLAPQPDRFGLLGLLSVIRMTDPDLTTLALGTDLTTLGLNLNSTESLWKTFASPWADGPSKPEPEFRVPQCYLHAPPRLQPGYFQKFQPDTLFYIFYGMPGDEAQLYAAEELGARGWYYHKEYKAWLTRAPNTEPLQKTDRFERGSFFLFDPTTWEVVRKDNFVVQFEHLERTPNMAAARMAAAAAPPATAPAAAPAAAPGAQGPQSPAPGATAVAPAPSAAAK